MTAENNTRNIFLIGNNPSELGEIEKNISRESRYGFKTAYSFLGKDIIKRLKAFNPSCILIDDNIGKLRLKNLLTKLNSGKSTRHIPVTLLKNSNFHDSGVGTVTDFILKSGITSESLTRGIFNVIHLKKAHAFFDKNIRNGRKKVINMMR